MPAFGVGAPSCARSGPTSINDSPTRAKNATVIANFMQTLEHHGERTALVEEGGRQISYRALAGRADAFAARLGNRRGLLLIEMTNCAEAVIAYVGAFRAGIPVILGSEGLSASSPQLIATFRPDFIYRQSGARWMLEHPSPSPAERVLHQNLAVLLSTSGSTGSAKLVKLSRDNVQENARSIVEYLEIDSSRVAIANLPAHYSYGLSVINSSLLAGATVVLTDQSVIADGFWDLVRRHGVTDLAGVPYTYELLERIGFRTRAPGSLRVMTQAGGRLPPDLVRAYATFAKSSGIRFFVMYGQTEATARMAYLPPNLADANADCVGIPIPGGRLSIVAPDGQEVDAAEQPGELVYRGPNVMMGYAMTAADLAVGPSLQELRTGDIAQRQPNGLVKIVGRASRFSKIVGVRIGFDDVERLVRASGGVGYVTGNDQAIVVGLASGEPEAVRQNVSVACGLPAHLVVVHRLTDVPTLASGKIDYEAIKKAGLEMAAVQARDGQLALGARSVAKLYSRALELPDPSADSSFSSLGADSLAYVTVSVGLEEMLGRLPPQWETIPIRTLQALVDSQSVEHREATTITIGTDVLLRLLALSLIFVGHGVPEQTAWMRGGSNILFCLAGYSMATFQVPQLLEARAWGVIKGVLVRLVLPYFAVMTLLLMTSNTEKSLHWYTLTAASGLAPEQRGPLFSFWFIEALVQATFLSCLLFRIPSFRSFVRRTPFWASIGLVGAATILRWVGAVGWPNDSGINVTLDGWLYALFIGWAVHFARRPAEKVLVVALAVILTLDQFGFSTGRPFWLAGAIALLLAVSTMSIERRLGRALAYLAGAAYFMYLAHAVVNHVVKFELGLASSPIAVAILLYVGSIVAGLAYAEAWRFAVMRLRTVIGRLLNGSAAPIDPVQVDVA